MRFASECLNEIFQPLALRATPAKPDDDGRRLGKYSPHQADLVVPFLDIPLINTHSINPQHSGLCRVPQLFEGGEKVLSNG